MVLVVATITSISHGRLGRLLEAMADSPLALETNGTTSNLLKVVVFCISAAMASLAGALTAMLYHFGVGQPYFESFASLTLVALVVIITIGDPWYAVIGAVLYTVIPGYITGNTVAQRPYSPVRPECGHGAAYGTRGGTTPQALRNILDRSAVAGPGAAVEPAAEEPGAAVPALALVRSERPAESPAPGSRWSTCRCSSAGSRR